jgi:hypothetical protein
MMTVAVLCNPLSVQVMVAVPAATPVTWPVVFTVAVGWLELAQVQLAVTSRVVPSLNVPVAANCWVRPAMIWLLVGVTTSEVRVAEDAVTVSAVEPESPSLAAEMAVVPAATPVARPAVVIEAVLVLELVQVAVLVMFAVDPFAYVPVAVYCCVAPTAMLVDAGVTVMLVRGGLVPPPVPPLFTMTEALPLAPLYVAETAVLPTATPVASPDWLMVATAGEELDQVAEEVTLRVPPPAKVAMAANCWVPPTAMVPDNGVT